jgi:hypothetical protein
MSLMAVTEVQFSNTVSAYEFTICGVVFQVAFGSAVQWSVRGRTSTSVLMSVDDRKVRQGAHITIIEYPSCSCGGGMCSLFFRRCRPCV